MNADQVLPSDELTLAEEVRRLLTLAWPVILGQLGLVSLNLTDTIFAGKVGESTLAAVALGNITSFSCVVFGFGLLRGLDPFFAQAHGAGDRASGARALFRALFFALCLCGPLIALHANMDVLMRLLGQPEKTIPIAAEYCGALAWGMVPVMVFSAIAQFSQGLGKMRPPMIAIMVANLFNIALDAILILGWERAGVPAMGAFGCGVATSIVQWIMVLVLIFLVRDTLGEYRPPTDGPAILDPTALGKMLRVSLPVGMQASLEGWAFSSLGVMMGMLGELELAAHGIAINLITTMFMFPFGMGAAAATRVGNLVGAGREWKRAAWLAILFSAGWMSVSATIFLLTSDQIASIFIEDAAVIAMVGVLMPVAAAFQIFDGVQAAGFGVLRGAGDTRLPAVVNMLGYWVIGIPLGYWFGVVVYDDPRFVWGGVAIALAIISTLIVARVVWVIRRGATLLERD